MNSEIRFDENVACDRCGQTGAYQVEGENLCAECINARGSCCPEFGSDDLWSFDDETPKPTKGNHVEATSQPKV